MRNSVAAGRRLAFRIVLCQLALTAAVAAGFAFGGPQAALGAGIGGGLVAMATAAFALRLFGPVAPSAGATLSRLIGGIALKWLLLGGGLYLAIAKAGLPPLAVLAGVLAGLAGNLAGLLVRE